MAGAAARLFLVAPLLAATSPATAGAWAEVADFGDNPGNVAMHVYAPDRLQPMAPLVVVLHGCAQTARAFAEEAGWTGLAELAGAILVAPEQRPANNALRCFRWFVPEQAGRGRGEARSIRAMVAKAVADSGADPGRAFVAGLSAGGAMAVVMLAAYPEAFRGGAVVAGVPFGCAASLAEAAVCLAGGRDRSPKEWGRRVRAAGAAAGAWPRISIWHGGADATVHPRNAGELMEQWTDVHGLDQAAEAEEKTAAYVRAEHRDGAGRALVETYALPGAGHGMPVAPKEGCGLRAVYALDVGICAATRVARFWGLETGREEGSIGGRVR